MVYIALATIAFLMIGVHCCMVIGKWTDKVLGYEGEEGGLRGKKNEKEIV